MIRFQKANHTYWHGDIQFISATTIKKAYIEPFDAPFWTYYKGLQEYLKIPNDEAGKTRYKNWLYKNGFKFSNKTIAELDRICEANNIRLTTIKKYQFDKGVEWDYERDKSALKGTKYHDFKESKAYKNGYDVIGEREATVQGIYSYDLSTLPDGFYAELLVYNEEWGLAGQVDKCLIETINGIRYVDIDDYKTSKKITVESNYKMLFPLNHFPSTDYYGFMIQINLYGFMLAEFGFKLREMRFTHHVLNEEGICIKEIPYPVSNCQYDILRMVKHYRSKNPIKRLSYVAKSKTSFNLDTLWS
jgi:hypothetical protein